MQSPNLEALVGGGKRYSFQQYNERVNQLAHYLLHNGVQKRRSYRNTMQK